MPERRIYLDHSATTPVDARVVEAMLPFFGGAFGNASSVHGFGQEARAGVDRARRQVASLIGAKQNEVVFVSGGTEANNLALRGVTEMAACTGRHIITSAIEHPSVRGVCDLLEKRGWEVTRLPVYRNGIVKLNDVRSALRDDTVLVSVMMANNEIGTIQPIREIAQEVRASRERGQKIWFHTDAVQAAGRLPVNVEDLGVDLVSLSAHKLYGPKGIAALYVRRGVRLAPQTVGGHQERERRAGTENVAAIVGFGMAAKLAVEEMNTRHAHDLAIRDNFEQKVSAAIADIDLNGDRENRLPHLSNISFRFIEGEGLLINLDLKGIAVSTGSACSSGTLEPSPVIRALGLSAEDARGSIRFSFGKANTIEDVDYTVEALSDAVGRLRELSPLNKKTHPELSSVKSSR
jgi:cysteine desulfurase